MSHRDHGPDEEIEYIKDIVTKDTDDMYYVDYFGKAFDNLSEPDYDVPGYIEALRSIIEPHIGTANPHLRVKYGWLKNKFNFMVRGIKNKLASGNLELDLDLEGYFNHLEYLNS